MMHLSYEGFHRDTDALIDFCIEVLGPRRPQLDRATDYAAVRRLRDLRLVGPSGQYRRITSTAPAHDMSSHA